MRHRVAHRKLGRVTEHRIAMLRNQALALLRHESIQTTVPRAKELRPFVERLITIAKRGVAAGDANGRTLHARRLVLGQIHDPEVVGKLFATLAPRFASRPGGYTRLLRLGFRRGDGAQVARVELLGSEYTARTTAEKEKAAAKAAKPKAGVGGRLRAAAERLRGKKSEAGPAQEAEPVKSPKRSVRPTTGEKKAAQRAGSRKKSTGER